MLKVGIAGARGLSTINGFKALPDVEVAALCDLDEDLLKLQAQKNNIPKTFRIFEDMLESDIDAVVIATPMQCHVPQALAALEAGKHVMSEVTAGVTMDELWWLIETVEKYNKVYMMAENYIYMPENQVIINMANQGKFGEVYFGEGEYIHDIKDLITYNYGMHQSGKTSWRKFWQLGKRGAFYPTHSLGPIMKCFPNDRIKSLICAGTGQHTAPDLRQQDCTLTLCQLESGKLIKIRVDCISNRPHNLRYYSLQGTKGCYEAARGLGDKPKVYLEGMENEDGEREWKPLSDFYNEFLPGRYKIADEDKKNAGHGGGDYFIVQDFYNAVTKGIKPAIDVYEACEWTAVALLSEISIMNKSRVVDVPYFRKNMPKEEQIIKL